METYCQSVYFIRIIGGANHNDEEDEIRDKAENEAAGDDKLNNYRKTICEKFCKHVPQIATRCYYIQQAWDSLG